MDIERLLSQLKKTDLPQELPERVLTYIHKAQKRRAILRTTLFGSFSLGSLVAVVYASIYLVQATTQTGFSQYVSLLFSDGAVLLASWKEFSLLLAESIPLTSIIVVLITLGIFVWSFSKTIEKRKTSYAFN